MMFKTPHFWYRQIGTRAPLIEYALMPLSWLYCALDFVNQKRHTPKAIGIPVICIGNLTAGGAGKTPTALALYDLIIKHGLAQNPYFLTRGYGGSITTPVLVDPQTHSYIDVGDEALLLATKAPTIKSADRVAGAYLAKQNGADLIIMDDGLQNPALYKDVRLVVIDGKMGLGNGRHIPAGPLRTDARTGLHRADAVIMIGDNIRQIKPPCPMVPTQIVISQDFKPTPDKPYIAFAGLGYPQKFFDTLKKNAVPVIETREFADHHPYADADIKPLIDLATARGAILITTKKDLLRIPAPLQTDIQALPITLIWSAESALVALLKNKLCSAS